MKAYRYHVWLFVLLMTGCAALGIPQPQTFNEKVAVAQASVTQARMTAASLVGIGKITPDDAQNVQNQANHAREGIDLARKVHALDSKAGDSKLASTITILDALNSYLKGRQ